MTISGSTEKSDSTAAILPPNPPSPADAPPEIGAQAAYDRYLAEAQKLPADKLAEYRADPQLAYQNARRGAENVLAELTRIKHELPFADVEAVRTLPQVAQGLLFSALQVNRDLGSPGTIEALLGRAHPIRRKLLKAAEALVESKVISDDDVAPIRPGRGKVDMANDCVALAAVFRRYEKATAGKTAITAADIAEADEVGSRLQTLLKTKGTPTDNRPAPGLAAAIDARSRFWTLVEARHEMTWRIGAWLWGRAVDEHVPPLQSRAVSRASAHPAKAAAVVGEEVK
jgi:hypothetical protein